MSALALASVPDAATHARAVGLSYGSATRRSTIMERTLVRVGNDEYARANRTYGLTTLRNRHVQARGAAIRIRFPGKGGKTHDLSLEDERVARILRRLQALPGQELFQYEGDDGDVHRVTSADANGYLRSITGQDVTAKDYRTWAGTLLAARALRASGRATSRRDAQRRVRRTIEGVARELGNTPAICRRSYVHPAVIEAYLDGRFEPSRIRRGANGLTADERSMLAVIA